MHTRRRSRRDLRLLQLRARRAEEVHRGGDVLRLRRDAGQGRSGRRRDRDAFQLPRHRWSAPPSSATCTSSARSPSRSTHGTQTRSPRWATRRGLVTQVGYHNRFVGAFQEVKRLLDAGAIGEVTHVLGEAYGPVVLKPKGGTWRSQRTEGGGCLYDYAAHVLDLVNWYIGEPVGVGGTGAEQRVLARDRRRSLQHPVLPPAERRPRSPSTGPTSPTAR